jgi:hypothetical protein
MLFISGGPFANNGAGLELAKRVYERADGKDAATLARMILAEPGQSPRERRLYSYAADRGTHERWSLMRFIEPADVEGTGLLTIDYPGDENDQWLYLPALDRVRRIASSRKGGRFVGSDFYYEDLRDREPEMDRHTIAGKSKVGKIPCTQLVSVPVDPDNSVYSKRVSCIHPDILVPLQVEFYEGRSERPTKRLSARRLKKIQGYWTVLDSRMEDLESGHTTRLVTEAIKYDQGLPDRLFNRQALSDDRMEQQYRP